MECAESLKKFIIKKLDGFTEQNVLVGSVDLSRYEQKNLCLILPEKSEIVDTNIGRGYDCNTTFTISFLFRGKSHSELVEKMEGMADSFQKLILGDYSLGSNVTDITPGEIKYYYDCGTVEKQATGLDIELTITEVKDF